MGGSITFFLCVSLSKFPWNTYNNSIGGVIIFILHYFYTIFVLTSPMTSRQKNSILMRQGKSNALQDSMWKIQAKFSNEPQEPNLMFFFFPQSGRCRIFMPHFFSDFSWLLPWRPHKPEQVLYEVHPVRASAETLSWWIVHSLNWAPFFLCFLLRTSIATGLHCVKLFKMYHASWSVIKLHPCGDSSRFPSIFLYFSLWQIK